MFGLLSSSALFGLLTIAWPLYLHLRRRRRRQVQVVPSLRIFHHSRRATRRLRIQQLLLLAARVFTLAALVMLISQAFWQTNRRLPLPAIGGSTPGDFRLGVVIDDSLTACHASEKHDRLALARKWLIQQLNGLPDSARIIIVPTSFPQPTPYLTKGEALEFVTQMQLVPQQGNAAQALRRLVQRLEGEKAGILVAAARSKALWRSLRRELDVDRPIHLSFLDTTDCRADCIITSVKREERGHGNTQWICRLDGDAPRIKGRKLVVKSGRNTELETLISLTNASRREVPLHLASTQGASGFLTVELAEPYSHPWFSYHFRVQPQAPGTDRIAICRELDDASLKTDRVLAAALRAVRPGLHLQHLTAADTQGSEVQDVSAVVVVGHTMIEQTRGQWFDRQVRRGVRILCVPTADRAGLENGMADPTGILPTWGKAVALDKSRTHPLKLTSGAALLRGSRPPLLAGLEHMPVPVVIEPHFAEPHETLLTTRDGKALIALHRLTERTAVWTFSFPASLGDSSAVIHPLFPFLLETVLLDAGSADDQWGKLPYAGEAVEPCSWFGRDTLEGTLVAPDGSRTQVKSSRSHPALYHVPLPGRYSLETGLVTLESVANARRERDPRVFTRQEWRRDTPKVTTVWVRPDDRIDWARVPTTSAADTDGRGRCLDLSPIFVALVLLLLLVEDALVLRNGRARKAITADAA